MTSIEVNCLVREPMRNLVSGLFGPPHSKFAEPNPAPLKSLLAAQGWCQNTLRLPFLPAGAELAQRLQAHWQTLKDAAADVPAPQG
jgi:hypothetical protein